MTSRSRTSTASVPRRAALVAAAGALVGSSLLVTSPARGDDLRAGSDVPLCAVVDDAHATTTSATACAEGPSDATAARLGVAEDGATVPLTAAVADDDAGASGGYAWLGAIAFVLLVVGSIGRIVGLRILYKQRKNKNL